MQDHESDNQELDFFQKIIGVSLLLTVPMVNLCFFVSNWLRQLELRKGEPRESEVEKMEARAKKYDR